MELFNFRSIYNLIQYLNHLSNSIHLLIIIYLHHYLSFQIIFYIFITMVVNP